MNCSRTNEKKKKKEKTNHRAKEKKKKKCLFLSDCPDEIFFPMMRLENFFRNK